ncbi:MAG: phosphoribosylformylglycinamidine synthase subunit PurS [Phycisphaeraceae bacterium]|nr:phosphoribosylformylglycinamidine synthase subunit PurS [Phycisphaeraceae bacterium]
MRLVRIEVRPHERAGDPRGDALRKQAASIGVRAGAVRSALVYLIEGMLSDADVERVRARLLTNSVLETSVVGASSAAAGERTIEVHPLPGVMDPVAETVRATILELTGAECRVSTGKRFDVAGISEKQAAEIASRFLANPVIEAVHHAPHCPEHLAMFPGSESTVRHVTITTLGDEALRTLSREGHLFLSLDEMRAIQSYFREQGREPTDVELETLAQTWSEHCVHKTLKSTVRITPPAPPEDDVIDWTNRPDHVVNADGSVTIHNLLKSTVAAATNELIADGVDWTLSVFVDNSGIIRFDDEFGVCVKVETHNHPSAIEPYGGAATGVGGCIRDIIGTGLGATPIANTDIFCVAPPDMADIPNGCLHPKRILTQVVAGVRDYGNRMGIPTVNGAVHFDERYVGNPLVFCGSIGVIPAHLCKGAAKKGDRIIALGGRTGRDGIHGATFSSAELTDSHADEFSHAVQIGNAIEEKRTLDAILRARDVQGGPLYNAITDCGAGGFSSAVGEMGEKLGAEVHLDRAPLKYEGLRYDEIWISESQERMVLAVPSGNVAALQQICDEEQVELADLGHFGTENAELVLNYRGGEVGRLSMAFLHDGIPMPTREAKWEKPKVGVKPTAADADEIDIEKTLLKLLSDPNIASKRWIVRQYDHEVQGNTIIKPLVGPLGDGPGDAAVIQPVAGSKQGLAIACGMATALGDPNKGGDPYLMALAAIDECVRNLVCVGADPTRIAILDNFCWPSCDKPENMGSLVRAAEGCYDGAKAYRTPFISGKDSLHNQFRTDDGRLIEIPPTLLISGVGIVPGVSKCVTMDAKLLSPDKTGSCGIFITIGDDLKFANGQMVVDPIRCAAAAYAVHLVIQRGLALAVHDVSEGGVLLAVAEMAIASEEDCGIDADWEFLVPWNEEAGCEDETLVNHLQVGKYVVQLAGYSGGPEFEQVRACVFEASARFGLIPESIASIDAVLSEEDDIRRERDAIDILWCGHFTRSGNFNGIPTSTLRDAFFGTLDW